MHAILIACSFLVNLDIHGSVWNSNIPNPEPPMYGNYRSYIKNPLLPVYTSSQYTYTASQLPEELDELLVEKIKSKKRQKIIENFKIIEEVKKLEEKMINIKSLNQISINNNGILDDINIPLYQMLDWLEFLEWKIISISTIRNSCSQIILKKEYIFNS